MKRYSLVLIMIAVIMFSYSALAYAGNGYPLAADGYKKLEIYYYFGYDSPIHISLDRARKISRTKIISTDSTYILTFIKWLHVHEMTSAEKVDISSTHAFIVIDLYRLDDGKIETFYSDGHYLYSVSPSMKRKVGDEFRKNFYFDTNKDTDILEIPDP